MKNRLRAAATLLVVALFSVVAVLIWGYRQYRSDVTELVQHFNSLIPAALTLHRDHFLSDPSSLHVLWWESTEQDIPGLTVHNLWIPKDEDNKAIGHSRKF